MAVYWLPQEVRMGQPDQPVAILLRLGWYLIGDDQTQTPKTQGNGTSHQDRTTERETSHQDRTTEKETVLKRPNRKPRSRKPGPPGQQGPPPGPSQIDQSDHETSNSEDDRDNYDTAICLIDSDKEEIHQAIQRMYQHDFIGRLSEDHSPEQTHFPQVDEFAIKQLAESVTFNEKRGRYQLALPWKHGRMNTA